jgi:hypothetical protein
MIKYAGSIILESIVLIEGTIVAVEKDVEATTIKKFEAHIAKVRIACRACTWLFQCLTVPRYGR